MTTGVTHDRVPVRVRQLDRDLDARTDAHNVVEIHAVGVAIRDGRDLHPRRRAATAEEHVRLGIGGEHDRRGPPRAIAATVTVVRS
jgi:hypothetical protein